MQRELHSMPSWCFLENVKVFIGRSGSPLKLVACFCQFDQKRADMVGESWREVMSGNAPPFLDVSRDNPTLTPLVFFCA
jgi:hypothetical protein